MRGRSQNSPTIAQTHLERCAVRVFQNRKALASRRSRRIIGHTQTMMLDPQSSDPYEALALCMAFA